MAETILQAPILTDFVYPFLIVFFITFAILDRTKLLGEGKKQINALLSFVIGLVFVSAVFPKQAVENIVLFLAVAIVMLFVFLLIWGFINGDNKENPLNLNPGVKITLSIVAALAFVVAALWATGVTGDVYNFFVNVIWGSEFVTNLVFVILIGIALAVVIANTKNSN